MFYPSYLGARLGSGLYQPPQEASLGMLGSGMYTPQAQGVVPRRRGLPQMPLGSGMFDATQPDDQQFSPHPLGSGLFGQPSLTSMAQQNPQAPQPQQAGQPQLAPVVDKSTMAQPQAQPSAEDKFGALLNNPMFQFGMNLLGSSTSPNPWGPALQNTLAGMAQSAAAKRADAQAKAEARRVDIEQQLANYTGQRTGYEGERVGLERQHMGNEGRRIDIEQTNADRQAPLTVAQTGLANAQTARSGAETEMDQQKMSMARDQVARQNAFIASLPELINGAPQSGAGPAQMSLPQGAGGNGKYGTPNSLLDGVMHVESRGDPNAVNPQSGATGAFQFMPATVDMLAKQGIHFDPRDPQQSRDAADFYLNMLTQRHGGDVRAALADYGGFKTKDPNPYIDKVMTAANNGMPPAQQTGITPTQPQQTPQTPQAPSGDRGLRVAQAGVGAAMAGLHGGEQLVEVGKMMQPQSVAAGSYQRDPSTGATTFMPNPYEAKRVENETVNTTNNVAKTGSELQEKSTKRAEQQAADTRVLRTTNGSLDRLSQNVDQLLKHPGLEANTGWHSTLKLNQIPNSQGKDASVLLDSLKSKMMVGTIAELKAMSKNGSTGFGQLSDREGQVAETLVSNLDRAQTFDSMKKALGDIKQFADEAKTAHAEYYNSMYGQGGPGVSALGPQSAPTAPQPAQPAPQSRAAPSSSVAISPRERKGTITPSVGTVQDNWVFMGGDPSSKNSWKPAPGAR